MVILILGPPGAGKGTQARYISEYLGIPHISTGDLFRQSIANKTTVGLRAKHYMDQGQLVPDDVVIDMFQQRISYKDCDNGFLMDGFPRTIPQAESITELSIIPEHIIDLLVPDETIIERLSGRRVCPSTEQVYHVKYNPPMIEGIDDKTGEKLIQREDDSEMTVKNRLKVYHEQTSPLRIFYKDKSRFGPQLPSYHTIDGSQTVETVKDHVAKLFK